MRKKLSVVLSAFMVAALLAIATTSASASAAVFTATTIKCNKGGTNVAFCYENTAKEKLLLTGEQSVAVQGGAVTFAINTTPKEAIECKESTGEGTIVQKEPSVSGKKTTLTGVRLNYKGCKLVEGETKTCKIKENESTSELFGTLESESTLNLQPRSGGLIEFTWENNGNEKCGPVWLGKHTFTGEENFTINEPGVPSETTTVNAAHSKGLRYFSNEVTWTQVLTMTFTGLGKKVYVSKEA